MNCPEEIWGKLMQLIGIETQTCHLANIHLNLCATKPHMSNNKE